MNADIKELVSLFRKYSYEFGASDDLNTYDLMLNVQKEIIDFSNAQDARIKQLEEALKDANEQWFHMCFD